MFPGLEIKLTTWFEKYKSEGLAYKTYKKRPMGLDALLKKQLGHGPKFQKLHTHCISTQGAEIELIFTLRAAVSDIQAYFQNCHIGHETWQVAKVPEVTHILSFYPRGSKFSFFFFALLATVLKLESFDGFIGNKYYRG